MTTYYAQSSGSFSSIGWNNQPDGLGGAPFSGDPENASGDEFEANGNTVAIDVALLVGALRCNSGGGFTIDLSSAKAIVADIYGHDGDQVDCLTGSGTGMLTIHGSCYGGAGKSGDDGSYSGGNAVVATNVAVTGDCHGGTGGDSNSTNSGQSGGNGGDGVVATTVSVVGDCFGGNGGSSQNDSNGYGGNGGNGVSATTITVTEGSYGGNGGNSAAGGENGDGGTGGKGGQGITGGSGSSVSGGWSNGSSGNSGSFVGGQGGLAFSAGTEAIPDAPIAQTATSLADASVTLTWLATQVTGATYSIFRNGTQIASGIAYETLSYTDTAAPIGVWSTYTVKASTSIGTSSASNAVSGLRVLLPGSIAGPDEVLSSATTLNADKNGYADGTATAGGSSGTYPNAAYVHSDAGTYGPNGTEYTPALSALTNWTLKSSVVDASYVVTGHDNYTGGSAGTYPTTATSKAEQLSADQAAVASAVAYIDNTQAVLNQPGELDMDLYVLKTAVVESSHVEQSVPRWTGATGDGYVGTLVVGTGDEVFPAAAYVHSDAGPYGPNGDNYTPSLADLSDYVAKANVVSRSHVEQGIPRWTGATGDDLGTYPDLDYVDWQTGDSIVNAVGNATHLLSRVSTLASQWAPSWLHNYIAAYAAIDGSLPNCTAATTSLNATKTAAEGLSGAVAKSCQTMLIDAMASETGRTDLTLAKAVALYFDQMKAEGVYFASPTIGCTVTAGNNTGDMEIAVSTRDAAGNPLHYACAERLDATVTKASAASVTLKFTADRAAVTAEKSNWPQGSGAAAAVAVVASANLLTNGSFDAPAESVVATVPDGWFVSSGTPAVDIKLTNIPRQLITVSSASANVTKSWQLQYTYGGKVYLTSLLSDGATAEDVQAALRKLPKLDSVAVYYEDMTGVQAGVRFRYWIYFYGYPGVPASLQAVYNSAAATGYAVTIEAAGSHGAYSSRAMQFPVSGATLPALCQQISPTKDTVYFFTAKARAIGDFTGGTVAIEVVNGLTSDPVCDAAGNPASLVLDATKIAKSPHQTVSFSFRVGSSYSGPFYLRIRVSEAITMDTSGLNATQIALLGVYLDEAAIMPGVQLYVGGPYVGGFFGRTVPSTSDTWALDIANDRAGKLLDAMNRMFGLAALKLSPPTTGTRLIADSDVGL
jgi:hypothetical protein